MAFESPASDPKQEIIARFLELYETADEMRSLLDAFFAENSITRDLLRLDGISDRKEMAGILVDYLGMNFLRVTAGKDNAENARVRDKDGKYVIREKLLERLCQRHADPEEKARDILDRMNGVLKSQHTDLGGLARDKRLVGSAKARQEMVKILQFPDIVFEQPPKMAPEEETTTMGKKIPLKPLYDYQVKALIHISEMLSHAKKPKRVLVNIPTGAGKTRLTVEAIVEWINYRNMGKVPHASPQQKNGRIVFWFASTNELCSQAAGEFVRIYGQIGTGGEQFNVTRLYGNNRRDLFQILRECPGTHIVVTNTEHFQELLKDERDTSSSRYKVDQYAESTMFGKLRGQTIAIVIDEAHEAISNTYMSFLAAMGFDFTGRKVAKECNHNHNNIALIGLTATPYRGSGRWIEDRPGIAGLEAGQGEDEFTEFDSDKDPPYFVHLDNRTKRIHKMFGRVYIPLPSEDHVRSPPVPIIEVPAHAHTDEHVKISGARSFDSFSDITYHWEIGEFSAESITRGGATFYHRFERPGTYTVKLTVTNKSGGIGSDTRKIRIDKRDAKAAGKSNLEDNKRFSKILQKRGILCRVVYGVMDGPQLEWNEAEIRRWQLGKLSERNEEKIESDRRYNRHICDIVSKAINTYGRRRILVFANGVIHSHNLALILNTGYGIRAKSVDGEMNPGLRRQTIHEFREGKISVLCNHGILTSGFDVPEIDTLLICRTVGSNALYTQMIGRGQRGRLAGGTEDLWLITAYFQKGQFDDIRLGWEALADSWEKFPDDIKEDLNIRDNVEYEPHDPKSVRAPEPGSKGFSCTSCGNTAAEIGDVRDVFGVEGDEEVLANALKDGRFPKNCRMCREIQEAAKGTKCEFCQVIAESHGFDPVMVAIARFAKSHRGGGRITFWDLQAWLYEEFHGGISRDFFGITNVSILRSERLGLVTIRGNMDLEVGAVKDPQCLDRIITAISGSAKFKDSLASMQEDFGEAPRQDGAEDDPMGALFESLCSQHGHMPTTRQFQEACKEFDAADYDRFLSDRRIIIGDDQNLRDGLYEEYFEKCVAEGREATRDELDSHGNYRISDYEEVFGSLGELRRITGPHLERLLAFSPGNADAEFDLIVGDLEMLQDRLGSVHFDTIRVNSRIGLHRYLAQVRISHLRHLQGYDGDSPGKFLRLVGEFFRLKDLLGMVPSKDHFINMTKAGVTAYLGDLFGFQYEKLLGALGESESPPDPAHVKRMREGVLHRMADIRDAQGLQTAYEIIDSASREYDDLSVSIKAWWPDPKELRRAVRPRKPNAVGSGDGSQSGSS